MYDKMDLSSAGLRLGQVRGVVRGVAMICRR